MSEMLRLGVMDSGVGGFGVLLECLRLTSGVRYFYFADADHAPYGSMEEKEIEKCVSSGLKMFSDLGTDAAVLACNTATAVCVDEMRRRFPFPVIGTEPAVRPAVRAGCKNILVLVTPRTRDTVRFRALLSRERGNFTVFAPPALASAVEAYAAGKPLSLADHLPEGNFDGVVLGCTHYTLVGEGISRFYSAPVFDGNRGTARRLFASVGLCVPSRPEESLEAAEPPALWDADRGGCPRSGISDHRKGALTTIGRFASGCEIQTENEVIFLISSKNRKKLCYEQTFFKRLASKNVKFAHIGEKFF